MVEVEPFVLVGEAFDVGQAEACLCVAVDAVWPEVAAQGVGSVVLAVYAMADSIGVPYVVAVVHALPVVVMGVASVVGLAVL